MEQDIETNNYSSSLLSPKNFPPTTKFSNGNDHHHRSMKRDEWSGEAVWNLLEAYEAKWSLRSRAKLKGCDWHDVATSVSAAAKSPKTHTQCKNKIESLKKRYRSEMAAESSSWPLYPHIDRLLRGGPAAEAGKSVTPQPHPLAASPPAQNSRESKSSKSGSNDKDITVTDPINVGREDRVCKKRKMEREIYEATKHGVMGWVAEMVARNEEARMEMVRETERIRMKAEEKKGELEVKRTQIIADVQLQIAKLCAQFGQGDSIVCSSLLTSIM